jgi:hypothetical protein
MKSSPLYLTTFALFCLGTLGTVQARDINVPAGTLMTCTLDEPKFSSATVSVGDPFLCYPRNVQQFGQTVFPRGAYLVGHLEGAQEPGHFVGKGYLQLTFDRIGLPSTDVPLTAKVIAVAHFNVDREGKIIGHGHATRDVVEWMLPPLWPWKVLTLPARGPRPTLKGETRITLRVMEDFVVPQVNSSPWHRFGEEPSSFVSPQTYAAPRVLASEYRAKTPADTKPAVGVIEAASVASQPRVVEISSPSRPADDQVEPVAGSALQKRDPQPANRPETTGAWPTDVTLFALTDGTLFPTTKYWRDRDQLSFVSGGDKGVVALKSIDWSATTRLNQARNVRVTLRNAPAAN